MEERISQMLAVIHVENEYIMKMLIRLLYSSKESKEYEKELIASFDKSFNDASNGKL